MSLWYHKTVDPFLPTSKFVPDWIVTNKMLEKLDNVVFSNDDIDVEVIESDIIAFFSNDMGLNAIVLNNINLDDDDFDEDDPTSIVLFRLIAWCNRFKQCKACKKRSMKI